MSQSTLSKKAILFSLVVQFAALPGFAQNTGTIYGEIKDKNTEEPLIGATITTEEGSNATSADIDGKYRLTLPVGTFNLKVSFIGYTDQIKYNVVVNSGNDLSVSFEMEPSVAALQEVTVSTKAKTKTALASDVMTPLSVQSLTTEEIRSNPGGNFDVSKVIQALPGVAGTTGGGGFRNDIILRGGGPNENVYYLDDIEIPILNHFTTQGSAGGPAGIINISFIEDIKLSTSAFNARFDNTTSGVFEFKQREGNSEKLQGNVRLSASEFAATFDGPAGPKTTYLVSARRSYLAFLFTLLDLPIRPDYWDFQTKISHKLGKKTSLDILGIGAIDLFKFAVPKDASPESVYILRSNSYINQWNYTGGATLKHRINNGLISLSLSRNHFNNNLERFEDNTIKDPETINFSSVSNEIENKLRLNVKTSTNGLTFNYGATVQQVNYDNDFFALIRPEIRSEEGQLLQPEVSNTFNTDLGFWKYGAYVQAGKTFRNQVSISGGLRTDMNSFTDTGIDPLKTLSPRLSASLPLGEKVRANATWGSYYKLPIYTVLGFQNDGQFLNRDNEYINSIHYAAGFEYLPKTDLRFTVEGFIKNYRNYPVSVFDNLSLANLGGGFGAIGNERVISGGEGKTYGFEVFMQQKLVKKQFFTLSYTFVRSKFGGINTELLPSAWDNRHLFSGIYGYKFGKNWELGVKYRWAGGSPYSPFDIEASQRNYLSLGQGIFDYSRLNSLRLDGFNQMDVRIDKRFNYPNWTLDLFIDVQNLWGEKNESVPNFTFQRNSDNTGFASTDGLSVRQDGSNAIPLILSEPSGQPTPSIGFIIEF
ncbi:TonB-dependent receptor [Jiulongibacter sediminis]|uniref:TonB-dependent receptor n=1 Tax=Jiulongibacter sediminis TaxID=1605367 RepID=UPI0009EA4070|nr:TonB-dependent receptor [Jiulongibacter sediminis]TBX21710.1 TonB-dependent receptor [Jiulongibacter sediminis]